MKKAHYIEPVSYWLAMPHRNEPETSHKFIFADKPGTTAIEVITPDQERRNLFKENIGRSSHRTLLKVSWLRLGRVQICNDRALAQRPGCYELDVPDPECSHSACKSAHSTKILPPVMQISWEQPLEMGSTSSSCTSPKRRLSGHTRAPGSSEATLSSNRTTPSYRTTSLASCFHGLASNAIFNATCE
jgi:hypothetical protein